MSWTNNRHNLVTKSVGLILAFAPIYFVITSPRSTFAAGTVCYDWENATSVGNYLECFLPQAWDFFKVILIVLTIIFTIWLIIKTVLAVGSANSQEIQGLPVKWIYVILLAFVAIGAAGSIINILLKFFGFGDFNTLIDPINTILDNLKARAI